MARCAGLFRSAPGLLEVGPSEGVAEGVVGEVEEVALELGEQRHAAELPALGHVHRAYNRGIVLLEQRSEVAAPPLAVDLAGQGLAAAAETWTALPYAGERAFSDGGLPRGTDYLHARFRSPLTGRFLSVDPVLNLKRTLGMPQAWNRYAYALGNPLRFVDPTSEIAIVSDFEDSTLSPRQQALVIQGIRAAYKRAGIKDVQVFFSTDKNRPEANPSGGPGAVVDLSYRTTLEGGGFGGWTPSNREASVSVESANWAGVPEGRLNMLINVGAHESAHGLGALPEYMWDSLPGYPRGMSGYIMEQVNATPAEAKLLGQKQRDFHPDDAVMMQQRLNPREDDK